MESYIPLLSGFAGALIGAAASILTILIQSKVHDKREKLKIAVELAAQDHKLAYDLLKNSGEGGNFPPVVAYLHYHIGLLKLMENDQITPDSIKELKEKNKKFIDAL